MGTADWDDSDALFPATGMISKRFIRMCHQALEHSIERGGRLYFDSTQSPDPVWDDWCLGQPSRQRSYLRTLHRQGAANALAAYINARDHALLISDSFMNPPREIRIWSYLSLARATCEAFMRAAVLMDRRLDPEDRLLQAAAASIDGAQEQVALARDVAPATVPKADARLSAVLGQCRRAGIQAERYKNRYKRLSRGGRVVTVGLNVTDETARRMPESPAPYRLGSAVSHSGAWFLASAMGDGQTFQPRADPDLIVLATTIVMESHLAVLESVTCASTQPHVEEFRVEVQTRVARLLVARQTDHA